MEQKNFELRIIDEDGSEFVDFVSFTEFDAGFSKFNSPEKLYEARKSKFSYLKNTKLNKESSTMTISEF